MITENESIILDSAGVLSGPTAEVLTKFIPCGYGYATLIRLLNAKMLRRRNMAGVGTYYLTPVGATALLEWAARPVRGAGLSLDCETSGNPEQFTSAAMTIRAGSLTEAQWRVLRSVTKDYCTLPNTLGLALGAIGATQDDVDGLITGGWLTQDESDNPHKRFIKASPRGIGLVAAFPA